MHLGDGRDAALGVGERRLRAFADRHAALHVDECGNELQAVGDAVVDLVKQRLEPGIGLAQRRLRTLLLRTERDLHQRLIDRAGEKIEEILTERLHHEVDRARLQCRDRDAALFRPRHIDDRRRRGEGHDLAERRQAVLTGHVMVDGDQIDTALGRQRDAGGPVRRRAYAKTTPFQRAPHQTTQAIVVVDIQNVRGDAGVHQPSGASGIWITDRNRPS